MADVILRNIRKTYPGGVEAIKGVDVAIGDGQFCVLVGRRAAASPRCCAWWRGSRP